MAESMELTESSEPNGLLARGRRTVNRAIPPEKRSEWEKQLRAFAANRPKLTAFLATNIALTGLPLLTFLTFTVTIFLSSLVVSILLGLLSAFLFTGFCIGLALLVTIPIVLMTTTTAIFLFTWAMACYFVVQWYNRRNGQSSLGGEAIGDKLQRSPGRQDSVVGGEKKEDDRSTSEEAGRVVNGSAQETAGGAEEESNDHISR